MNNVNDGKTHEIEIKNDSGTKGVRCYVLDYDTKIERTEPEVEILHPNTSENIRCFLNSMSGGQKEAFAKSHSDDILRALLG